MKDQYDKLTDREIVACCQKVLYDAQIHLKTQASGYAEDMPLSRVIEVCMLVDAAAEAMATILRRPQ